MVSHHKHAKPDQLEPCYQPGPVSKTVPVFRGHVHIWPSSLHDRALTSIRKWDDDL